MSEYHVRYGRFGGVAFHYVSALYIALLSHFIACGAWEGIYLIDAYLRNQSRIQPTTIHADTQGQSAPIFGMAFLLGIQLMPRIRNWKGLTLYRPDRRTTYRHIDTLCTGVVDWDFIEGHWDDLLQAMISIQQGRILPSTLLRKLGHYSRKNTLYQAFKAVGDVVRTVFLLEYVSRLDLRAAITAETNKVEAYNGFCAWVAFGGDHVLGGVDADTFEKRVKYTDVLANALILHNVVDMSVALERLNARGYVVAPETVAHLSPYTTRNWKRFGDFEIDLAKVPPPLTALIRLFAPPAPQAPAPAAATAHLGQLCPIFARIVVAPVLRSFPDLLYAWGVCQAVGIDAQLVATWDRVRTAMRGGHWWAVAGLVLLGCALGYVGFLSAEAFGLQQAFGLSESDALARLGIDAAAWQLQRAVLAVFLVALAGFTRYHAPPKAKQTLEDERAHLARELELEPLRQRLRAQRTVGVAALARQAFSAATGREPTSVPVVSTQGKAAGHSDRPPTGGGSPAAAPTSVPVRTPSRPRREATLRLVDPEAPGRRKPAARGRSNTRGSQRVRTPTDPDAAEAAARAAWQPGLSVTDLQRAAASAETLPPSTDA